MQLSNSEHLLESFPLLETARLSLVEIKQEHLPDIYKLFGDKKVTEFYNMLPLKSEQEAQKTIDWFRDRFKDKLGIRWGISLKGHRNIIGTVGFNNYKPKHRAGIGYDLQAEHWNKGYMTEALKAVINYGFSVLYINRIEAEVMHGNIFSEKLLEKLNFKKEGVLREWMLWNEKHYDMSMYSLLKSEN